MTATDQSANPHDAIEAPDGRRAEVRKLLDEPVGAAVLGGMAWLVWSAIFIAADALGGFSGQYDFGIGASMAILYLPFMVAAPVCTGVLVVQWVARSLNLRAGAWLLSVPMVWSAIIAGLLAAT